MHPHPISLYNWAQPVENEYEDKMSVPDEVEIRFALAFDCPLCGVEQFLNALVPETCEDSGFLVRIPEQVTCKFCNLSFNTVAFNEEPPQEDLGYDYAEWSDKSEETWPEKIEPEEEDI